MTQYTTWKDDGGLEYVRRCAEDGLSNAEIAKKVGISEKTFYNWKKRYPEFDEALILGKMGSDIDVVRAIYKRATGYKVSVNRTVKLKRTDFDPQTGKKIRDYEELATAVDESYVPADVRAGIFWIKSRQPERWSEHPLMTGDGLDGGIIELPQPDTIDGYGDDERENCV